MSTSDIAPTLERPRAATIVVGCCVGFVGGQILALLLEVVGVGVTHYPEGLSALSKLANPPWWSNVLGLVGLWVGFAAAIYFAHREGRLRPWPHQWRPELSDLAFVVVGVAAQFVIDLLYAPFHIKNLNGPANHLFKAAHGPGFVAVGLLTIFVAPFFEEWLFRGVLFRAVAEGVTWRTPARSVALGVVVSAVLFGLAHAEVAQFAGLALLGVVLALIFQQKKRLVPSYLTHASFNATAFVAIIIQRSGHS